MTVVGLAVRILRRQPVCEQDEGSRCVYFTADVRWAWGLEVRVMGLGGTAAPFTLGQA